ncbi:hypothetical protein HIM_03456 [Hirsutella minnesotensis 3608]|uniref:Nucleotide-diphospho-sugar transferase domain-containing protein n=1 Tax=Hirsutella minnesotensis 3608 TaxID=1043627 RepID=A0A0F7ZQF0_9HYPO|nr:hypothetical protein HIM_03456 [Hirsutella minnesotensis 3608]
MIFNASVRSTRGNLFLLSAVVFLTLFLGLWSTSPRSWDVPPRTKTELTDQSPLQSHETSLPNNSTVSTSSLLGNGPLAKYANELRNFFYQQLWKPSIVPSALHYRPFGAYNWTLTHPPVWNDPLGNDLCIIDLDNRPFSLPGQIFGPTPMTWDDAVDIHGLSLGILNHWLYAKIHGYKYYYVAVEDPPDRRSSWKKPPVLTKILREHEVCVYLDSDAIFPRLDLPFEWLLNYWQLFPNINSLALAFDPDLDTNKDMFGKLYVNTGFIVAQNNPKTYEILDAWQRCPDDGGPFPGCQKFRYNVPGQPTDQGGFGTFIRYNYSDSIRELPCTEANGFPQNDWGCKGQFIRHLWTGKSDQIKIDVGEQVPGPYLQLFHQQFRDERNDFYMTEADLMSKGPKAALKKQHRASNDTVTVHAS